MALTTRDMEILSAAFQCLKDPDAFKVDYQKLATLAGFKTAASASNSFFLVRKKINAGAGALANAASTEKDSEYNANGDGAGGPNHDEGPTTPLAPSAKKRVRKTKAPPTNPGDTNGMADGEENGDEPTVPTPSTPKKRARKPKGEPQSGDEAASTPKKRARKAVKPKAGEEAKVVTPHSGGDEDSTLPTPASPSPAKKRARKPSTAKREKKSTDIVAEDDLADEAENNVTAATNMTKAKLADSDNQYTAAILGPGIAPNEAGTSAVLAAEIAAAAANEYSKGGQSEFLALVSGSDQDDNAEGETTDADGHGVTPA